MTRRFLGLALTLIFAAATVAAAAGQEKAPPSPPAAVAGKWTAALDMAMGTATIALEFKQDGEKITGTYTGRYGAFPLEGVVKGRALEFVVTTSIEGQTSELYFQGDVAADGQSMKGQAMLGGAGEASWTAKRAKAPAPGPSVLSGGHPVSD